MCKSLFALKAGIPLTDPAPRSSAGHSYSQLILRPYGWVAPAVEAPPNDAEHTQIGQEMADAIEASMGEEYTSQPSTSLYATCGSAGDYLYSEFGAALPHHRRRRHSLRRRCLGLRSA